MKRANGDYTLKRRRRRRFGLSSRTPRISFRMIPLCTVPRTHANGRTSLLCVRARYSLYPRRITWSLLRLNPGDHYPASFSQQKLLRVSKKLCERPVRFRSSSFVACRGHQEIISLDRAHSPSASPPSFPTILLLRFRRDIALNDRFAKSRARATPRKLFRVFLFSFSFRVILLWIEYEYHLFYREK